MINARQDYMLVNIAQVATSFRELSVPAGWFYYVNSAFIFNHQGNSRYEVVGSIVQHHLRWKRGRR